MDKSITDAKVHLIDSDYQQLVSNITSLWHQAREKAFSAVNTELLEANWQTGKYILWSLNKEEKLGLNMESNCW